MKSNNNGKTIKNILFFSSDEQGESKSNRYHVAQLLSAKYRVIFIERQFLTVLSVFRRPSRFFNLFKIFTIDRKGDLLLTITPPLVIPGNILLIRLLNVKLISLYLKFILRKIKVTEYLTWVVSPYQLELLRKFPGVFSVYHCHDGYAYHPNVNKEEVLRIEDNLKSKVDIIFYASKELYATGKYMQKSYYIGHGCDSIFLKCDTYETPEDIKVIPRPIVGFHGIFNFPTDEKLLEMIIKKYPTISFVFVGPIYLKAGKKLAKYSNFFLLGQKPFECLPAYLKCFDLGILPLKKIPWTKTCSPLKLYEYLACGLPILSTDIPEVHVHKKHIYIAKNNEHFCELIPELLSRDHDRLRQQRYAESHLWSKKVDFMIKAIHEKYLMKTNHDSGQL